ncbi:hypothetical protein Taro_031837 [Colocasia esculenta]|uniref:Uncharacterized protein n=1 Tax=Colocasia esculenta TaxID=4460 RepID=A0A843W041_COLES|nr:hypothetical protein [Colocasia esculenta]
MTLLGVSGRGVVRACACWAYLGYEPAVSFLWWLPHQFSFARCSALEGLSARQVVTVTWDPHPHTPVSERASPGGGRARVTDSERRGKRCVSMVCFHVVLLWPDPSCGSWRCSSCFCLLEFLLLWMVRDW